MKNTIWFFGDSYINGWLCKPGDIYYELSNDVDKRIISDIVSDYFNMIPVNLAEYGFSNDGIIYTITENLKNFNKNDIVCIFDTFSARSYFVAEYDSYYLTWPKNTYIILNDKNHVNDIYNVRNLYTDKLINFYTDIYKNINLYLNSIGIQSYYFPSDDNFYLKNNFNRINEDIKTIDDGHWSFYGHRQAVEWVINIINK